MWADRVSPQEQRPASGCVYTVMVFKLAAWEMQTWGTLIGPGKSRSSLPSAFKKLNTLKYFLTCKNEKLASYLHSKKLSDLLKYCILFPLEVIVCDFSSKLLIILLLGIFYFLHSVKTGSSVLWGTANHCSPSPLPPLRVSIKQIKQMTKRNKQNPPNPILPCLGW